MTTLFGWGPMFGLAFDRATADLDSVSKHKAPYVEDDGEIIQDSTFIRWHFESKLGIDLNEGLSEVERAAAWAFERMLEDRLARIQGHERWLEGDNFQRGPAVFFLGAPEALRGQIIDQALANVRVGMEASGLGRHTRAERLALAERDIAAAADLLGDKPYMLADRPTALDAAAFGVIAGCTAPIFDTPLKAMVASHGNLVDYLERMRERYFEPNRWPSMVPTPAQQAA